MALELLGWGLAAKAPKTVRIMIRLPSMSKSTAKTAAPLKGVAELVDRFLKDLERQEASPRTRASYHLDLLHFFRWFEQTVGTPQPPRRPPRLMSASIAATSSTWSGVSRPP